MIQQYYHRELRKYCMYENKDKMLLNKGTFRELKITPRN